MNAWCKVAAVTVAGCLSAIVAGAAANAAEITVVASGGPLPDVMGTLVPMFESATGNKVKISFKGEAAIAADLKQGAVDLVITNTETVDELATSGEVAGNGKTLLMISKVGVAVKAGAPKPDISTAEGFKQAMLNARSIGHSNGGTGPYNTRLFQKLGIYDQIKDKIKIIQGKPVAVAVADGEVEIGIQQTNVIQPVAGTQYLGPLPPDLIEYGHFGVAVRNVSKNQDVARELIKFMTSPEAAALLRKTAMEPAER